jgi:Fic family protein
MAHYVPRRWKPDPSLPMDPRHRTAFDYRAYVPDEIAGVDPTLASSVARVLQEADDAVRALNHELPGIAALEALARQLLRQESVASSRIEGLVLSHRRLARAVVADDDQHRDMGAEAVLGNIAAMEQAITVTSKAPEIRTSSIVDIHRTLLQSTRDARIAGVVRESQNWIGGSNYSPQGAAFVPPPPGEVPRLMDDLAAFLSRADLPPTLQAAIAHAQFETIHPFPDGNGRVGRCLIHVAYRRAELAPRYVPPVSLLLATRADSYVNGLTSYRSDRAEDWYLDFALTVIESCRAARDLAQRIDELEGRWLEQAGGPRKGSAARRLIQMLPGQPILRIQHAIELTGASSSAAHAAVNELTRAGVLRQINVGKRNRAWEAVGLLKLLDAFERQLATPKPDGTKPVRHAPFLN